MTDLAQKREEVKKQIRSLLVSSKAALTLLDLERDYSKYIGGRLPSRQLGYANTEELLMDIPDTVEVYRNNGSVILRAVHDATTSHIEQLVSKQKLDGKKKRGTMQYYVPPCLSLNSSDRSKMAPRNIKPLMENSWQSKTTGKQNLSNNDDTPQRDLDQSPKNARHRNLPQVPAYLRSQINELVKSCPDGLPLTHVSAVFQKHNGYPLDHTKHGFSTAYDLLASLADIVTLKHFAAGEIRVMSTEAIKSIGEAHQNTVPHEQMLADKNTDLYNTSNIPVVIQEQIRGIMSVRPQGLAATQLPSEYKRVFNKELPYKTFGYPSVIEFASDMSNIIKIQRPQANSDWWLLPVGAPPISAPNKKAEPSATQKNSESSDVRVDRNTKEAVAQVLNMHPDGILLDKFEKVYKIMTGHTLDYEKYGANSLKHLLHSMSDILFISLNNLDKLVVCPKSCMGPRRFDRLLDQYQPLTVRAPVEPVESSALPPDAVGPGTFFKPQPLPKKASYSELYISYVISPAVFWIQLRGPRTTLALEDLMDELGAVYNSKHLPESYHMSSAFAKPGMICAVIYPDDGFWHRGIIMRLKDQMFEVYYVDYGNVCFVSLPDLRFLKKKFMSLPAQGIRSRLTSIVPVGGVWRTNSRNRLLALSNQKPLIGLVTHIKNGVLSLCLTDTTEEDDIHINDVLVSEGYADFLPDGEDVEIMCHPQAPSTEFLYGESRPLPDINSTYTYEESIQAPSTEFQYEENKPNNYIPSNDADSVHAASTDFLYGDKHKPAVDKNFVYEDTPPVVRSSCRYIRQVQISEDRVMNLINLNAKLYSLSSEISSLFFDEDILSAQLYKDKADVPKVVVTREDYPDLFRELSLYGAANFTSSTNVLSLYAFSSLPLLIELYGGNGDFDEVKETVLEILIWFDPEDLYWKGEGDSWMEENLEEDINTAGGNVSDMPTVEQLLPIIQSLEIKKKRILDKILSSPKSTPEIIGEFNEVEQNIKRVKLLLSKIPEMIINRKGSNQNNQLSAMKVEKNPEPQIPVTPAHLKSVQQVAPIPHAAHATAVKPEPLVNSGTTASLPAPDISALLQQHLLISRLMLEQLNQTQQANSLQTLGGQLGGYGSGLSSQQQQIKASPELQEPVAGTCSMVTQSLPNPVLSLGNSSTAGPSHFTNLLSTLASGPGETTLPSMPRAMSRGPPLDLHTSQPQPQQQQSYSADVLSRSLLQSQMTGNTSTVSSGQIPILFPAMAARTGEAMSPNSQRGVGRGLPLELSTTPQQQPQLYPADLLAQYRLFQSQLAGGSLLQGQNPLQRAQLLQQLTGQNTRPTNMADLGLSSLEGLTGAANLLSAEQQTRVDSLLRNMGGLPASSWNNVGISRQQ